MAAPAENIANDRGRHMAAIAILKGSIKINWMILGYLYLEKAQKHGNIRLMQDK